MQDPSHRFKGDVMDLRLDIERRKRFAGREREDKRSPGGSRGPSRDRSSEKSGKRHKKSKYVCFTFAKCWRSWLCWRLCFMYICNGDTSDVSVMNNVTLRTLSSGVGSQELRREAQTSLIQHFWLETLD